MGRFCFRILASLNLPDLDNDAERADLIDAQQGRERHRKPVALERHWQTAQRHVEGTVAKLDRPKPAGFSTGPDGAGALHDLGRNPVAADADAG